MNLRPKTLASACILMAGLAASASPAPAWADGKSIKITDGDSIVVDGERIRVMGVDTAELHARCPAELELALAAKRFTADALRRGPVTIERGRLDRYGRTLAVVRIGDRDLAAMLIEAGLGRVYHGEKRRSWC